MLVDWITFDMLAVGLTIAGFFCLVITGSSCFTGGILLVIISVLDSITGETVFGCCCGVQLGSPEREQVKLYPTGQVFQYHQPY